MNNYLITFIHSGTANIKVQAKDEEEANKIAQAMLDEANPKAFPDDFHWDIDFETEKL